MSMLDQFKDNMMAGHDKADEIIALLALNCRQLEKMIDQQNALLAHDEYLQRSDTAVVDASGNAEVEITPRAGFIIQLLGLATTATTTGTGITGVYRDHSGNGQNLLWAKPNATLLSDAFPAGTIIPENSKIVFRFTGLTAGNIVTASITAKRLRLHTADEIPGVPY